MDKLNNTQLRIITTPQIEDTSRHLSVFSQYLKKIEDIEKKRELRRLKQESNEKKGIYVFERFEEDRWLPKEMLEQNLGISLKIFKISQGEFLIWHFKTMRN